MGVDFDSFKDVLKHPIRRNIILALHERECLSYMELMNVAESTSTGKLNYHLKMLGDLISKDIQGKYSLTEKGRLTAQFLQKFPEKTVQRTTLQVSDAALISLAGLVLVAANPALIVGIAISAEKFITAFPVFIGLIWISEIYAWIVPGTIMWVLATRRTHSHDTYDMLKPPLIGLLMAQVLAVAMILVHFDISASIVSSYGANQTTTQVSLTHFMESGSILFFVGVAISEGASRIRKRFVPMALVVASISKYIDRFRHPKQC
jgi:glucan phosphoethanolaminetransferase (alkaline phosphatase superfamily)